MSCSYFQELISALIDDELDEKEVFYLQDGSDYIFWILYTLTNQ